MGNLKVGKDDRVELKKLLRADDMLISGADIAFAGMAIDEAANDVAFVSTGMYGKPLPPQNGGPLRLTLPWKYGFKSAKALAKITFGQKQPVNFWQAIQPSEYGFWANVNPAVAHPRWSQATERLLGTNEVVPTQIYNGYGEFVASLYANRTNEKLFM